MKGTKRWWCGMWVSSFGEIDRRIEVEEKRSLKLIRSCDNGSLRKILCVCACVYIEWPKGGVQVIPK